MAAILAANKEPMDWPDLPNHPVVAPLLERGARIRGRDQFCATDPLLANPARLFPNPSFL